MGIREEADALADEEPGRVSHLGQKVLIRRAYLAGAKRVLEMVRKSLSEGGDWEPPCVEALLREVEGS